MNLLASHNMHYAQVQSTNVAASVFFFGALAPSKDPTPPSYQANDPLPATACALSHPTISKVQDGWTICPIDLWSSGASRYLFGGTIISLRHESRWFMTRRLVAQQLLCWILKTRYQAPRRTRTPPFVTTGPSSRSCYFEHFNQHEENGQAMYRCTLGRNMYLNQLAL